jgi:serine phosphatase RsbU (regulator of sigma subunit)
MLKLPFLKRPVSRDLKQPLPVCFPVMRDTQFAARYQGARVGGDFFDVIMVGGRLVFLMLDIAGRREYALNVAAVVQLLFREIAEDLFAAPEINEADAVAQLALAINRGIFEITGEAHFATGFFGCYREDFGTLTYVSAGHPPAYIKDSKGVTELLAQGLPLGLFLHATHDAQISVLEPGAVLLLYSRGIMEARHRKREFGTSGVRKLLTQSRSVDANDLCNQLLREVQSYANGSAINNDLTTIVLRRGASAAAHV